MFDVQRANMWKRISAYIIDFIFLIVAAVGVASVLSYIFSFDTYSAERNEKRLEYEASYNITFDITEETYTEFSELEKEAYNTAYEAFMSDPEVNRLDMLIINLTLIIISFSFLISYLILEIIIPLLLKNGQTFGKKVFGIGVMREDGVKVSTFQIIVRTFLGKFTVETMLPIFLVLLFFFNVMPLFCLVGLALLVIVQAILTFATKMHTPIHDAISGCVTIDIASQMIFDSKEEMTEYKKRASAESVDPRSGKAV